jgi:hypothetical protein
MFGGYIGVETILVVGQGAASNVMGIVVRVALTKCVELSVVGVTYIGGTLWYSLDVASNCRYKGDPIGNCGI